MAPDHSFLEAGGGVNTGVETMKQGWKDFFRMFPDYRNEMSGFLQDGNLVMAYGRPRARCHPLSCTVSQRQAWAAGLTRNPHRF